MLVVFGHIVTQGTWDRKIISNVYKILGSVIYSFHMSAFFAISGFLSYRELRGMEVKSFIKRKFLRLMVPYLAMSLIYIPFRLLLSNMSRNEFSLGDAWKFLIGNSADGALWYLYALFVISVVVCLTVKQENLKFAFIVGCGIYIFNSYVCWPQDFIIDKIFSSVCFYVLGMLWQYGYENIKLMLTKPIAVIGAGIAFLILNVVCLTNNYEWVGLFTSISGGLICFAIACRINLQSGLLNRFFNAMGEYGMDIYILSEPIKVIFRTILKKTSIPPGISEVMLLALVLIVSYYSSKLMVRKIKPMRVVFLGMK